MKFTIKNVLKECNTANTIMMEYNHNNKLKWLKADQLCTLAPNTSPSSNVKRQYQAKWISQKFFFSLTVQIHIWPLLARFLHDPFTEHHLSASQEWLRLGSDVLHMAVLILLSAVSLNSWGIWPLFLTVSKAHADSSALADSIWQGEVCDCSPDRYPAWPRFACLPGNSPGQVSHGPAHLYCHPATGTATALLTRKSHPMLIECFVVRLSLTRIFMLVFLPCSYKMQLTLLARFKLLGSAERMWLHGNVLDWPKVGWVLLSDCKPASEMHVTSRWLV